MRLIRTFHAIGEQRAAFRANAFALPSAKPEPPLLVNATEITDAMPHIVSIFDLRELRRFGLTTVFTRDRCTARTNLADLAIGHHERIRPLRNRLVGDLDDLHGGSIDGFSDARTNAGLLRSNRNDVS